VPLSVLNPLLRELFSMNYFISYYLNYVNYYVNPMSMVIIQINILIEFWEFFSWN
jgi:hypothetical protein